MENKGHHWRTFFQWRGIKSTEIYRRSKLWNGKNEIRDGEALSKAIDSVVEN